MPVTVESRRKSLAGVAKLWPGAAIIDVTSKGAEDAEEAPPPEHPEELRAAERKRAAERERTTKRAEGTGYLIGGLLSAAVLWPLGRWMNKSESRTLVDQQTGQVVEAPVGGGHTLFFVPLEYWSFIRAGIGLFKFLSRG
jgi:hypothetical protein